jgi:hypothetical protein
MIAMPACPLRSGCPAKRAQRSSLAGDLNSCFNCVYFPSSRLWVCSFRGVLLRDYHIVDDPFATGLDFYRYLYAAISIAEPELPRLRLLERIPRLIRSISRTMVSRYITCSLIELECSGWFLVWWKYTLEALFINGWSRWTRCT